MGFWHYYGTGPESDLDKQLKKVRPKLPYGFAFAVGALLAFPQHVVDECCLMLRGINQNFAIPSER